MSQPSSMAPPGALRIVHVTQSASFVGGVERIVFDLASALADRGWPQALLHDSQSVDAQFASPFEAVSTNLDELSAFGADVAYLHKVESGEWVDSITERMPTVRMFHDHDVVCLRRHKYFPLSSRICHNPIGFDCYRHLCFVQRQRGAGFPVRFASVGKKKAEIASNQRVGRFVVGSDFMREQLITNGFERDKIRVIPPVPASLASVAPVPMGVAREILFVGQVIRGKGVDLLLHALARLEDDWHATVVGSGSHLSHCQALAERLGISDKVTFAGLVPHQQLERFYAAARVVVVPSRWPEPFGMVGLEAMSRARPVVAFAVGGIPDWLVHEQTGLSVNEGDTEGLCAAIARLLDDPQLAETMGARAAQRVGAHFRHDDCVEQTMKTLREAA